MAVQRTNSTSIQAAREETFGVLPTTPSWKLLQPNDIPNFGKTLTTKARNPINRLRQMGKGSIVDMDSGFNDPQDFIIELVKDWIDVFCFANFSSVAAFVPTACTTSAYTVAAGGALDEGTLVFARGFFNTANNGLKIVDSGSGATTIPVTATLIAETVSTTVELDVCGVQGASGDIEVDASGNITSTTLDFTGLNLSVGQVMYVGDGDSTSAFSFTTAADSGIVRILTISANEITFDKSDAAFTVDDGTGKTIRLFFGPFVKNVATDDADFLEQSVQFEIAYNDLDPTEYEYSEGNYPNTFTLTTNLNDLATVEMDFVGKDTSDPTTTRRAEAANGIEPIKVASINTTSDFARLRLAKADETGLATYVKAFVLTIDNGISPEKVLNQLDAAFMNYSNFNVSAEITVLFTDTEVITALNNNETVSVDFCLHSDDGCVYFDVPSMVLGGGTKNFPINESVNISLSGQSFEDETFNSSIGVSYFPYFPE